MKLPGIYSAARWRTAFLASHAPVVRRCLLPAGRDTAPSGVPTRLYRVGGEGTRLRSARGAWMVLWVCGIKIFRFFTARFAPPFFVASVVTPPESPDLGIAPQNTVGRHGH